MTIQDLLDKYGFLVIAYTNKADLERDRRDRIVSGETINWSGTDDCKVVVIGEAAFEDWVTQCHETGDPVYIPEVELPQVGYLKVTAE